MPRTEIGHTALLTVSTSAVFTPLKPAFVIRAPGSHPAASLFRNPAPRHRRQRSLRFTVGGTIRSLKRSERNDHLHESRGAHGMADAALDGIDRDGSRP